VVPVEPKVDIVILAYNSGDMLKKTLPAVLQTDYPDMEVTVIDNGSSDGCSDFIPKSEYRNKVKRIKLDKNYGCAGGLKRSIGLLSGKYVAFLNEDIVPDPAWLRKSVAVMEKDSSVAAVMSRLVSPKGVTETASTRFDLLTCSPSISAEPKEDVPYAGLGASVFRTSRVKETPLEERYFIYFEDLDYSLRLRARGDKIKMCQESILYHHHQKGSIRTNFTKADIWRISVRNRIFLFFGFYPLHLLFLFSPFFFLKILIGGMRHAVFSGWECGPATFLGMMDAMDLDWIVKKRKQTAGAIK
jgi:GT2 family glycosyltransferase